MRYFNSNLWGAYDSYWVAHYQYCGTIATYTNEQYALLTKWDALCQSATYIYPYDGLCIICDKPVAYRLDTQGRLHGENAMAMEFSDGWGILAFHGVRVSEQVIMRPDTLTAQQITKEDNAEIRRIMVERFGHARYIIESGARLLHEDDYGKLWRADFADDEPLVMVEVACPSTERGYFLRVDPQLRPMRLLPNGERQFGAPQKMTAHNAVASTFGMRGEEYLPAQET